MKILKRVFLLALVIVAAWGLAALFPKPRLVKSAASGRPAVSLGDEGPDCPVRRIFVIEEDPLARGKALYSSHCASCHGETGNGQGAAAVFLYPKPRNFTLGQFKIRSTPSGLPTDEDLFGVITSGMAGTPMPGFAFLKERDRRDLVAYVKQLSTREENARMLNYFVEAPAGSSIPMSAPPEFTPEMVAAGARIYAGLDCANCHGSSGAGDGPLAAGMKDTWGGPLKPRHFSRDKFIGGDSPEAIYTRIATGIGGTPMVAYPDSRVAPNDRWALVAYIRSLRETAGTLGTGRPGGNSVLSASRHQEPLPTTPDDPAWETSAQQIVAVNPVWRTHEATRHIAVRALHDGKNLAILLEWACALPKDAGALRVQDFSDAAALQFSLTEKPGFIAMGDPFHPVNLWQWRAGTPKDSPLAQMAGLYPQKKADIYPDAGNQYFSAAMAGNPLDNARTWPVEEANASGFGTLTVQPAEEQNVRGTGIWADGHWRVVFVRQLAPHSDRDANFSPGHRVPLAFAIFDGRNRDRNGQKNVSTWHILEMEK